MRVTTQMLNETARKSGFSFTGSSLLNQINQNGTNNGLLQALNKNNSASSNTLSKQNYEKLKKSADRLLEQAEKFAGKTGDSILDKFQEDEENKEIYTGVEDMIKSYNNTLKELQSLPGTLNNFYAGMLRQAAAENKEALQNIGVTVLKDGTLQADTNKMKEADPEYMKQVLKGTDSFAGKTAFLAARISDNAAVNMKSASNQYNAEGNIYSALMNRYDFRG